MQAAPNGKDLRTLHAANSFVRQLYQAEALVVQYSRTSSFEVSLGCPEPEELLRQQRYAELLEDLIALEDLTGQPIGPAGQVPDYDRVRIQQTRLLYSGKVVQWDRALAHSVVSTDSCTPRWAPIKPTVYETGGVRITTPKIHIGHREAIWHDEGPVPKLDRTPGDSL